VMAVRPLRQADLEAETQPVEVRRKANRGAFTPVIDLDEDHDSF